MMSVGRERMTNGVPFSRPFQKSPFHPTLKSLSIRFRSFRLILWEKSDLVIYFIHNKTWQSKTLKRGMQRGWVEQMKRQRTSPLLNEKQCSRLKLGLILTYQDTNVGNVHAAEVEGCHHYLFGLSEYLQLFSKFPISCVCWIFFLETIWYTTGWHKWIVAKILMN